MLVPPPVPEDKPAKAAPAKARRTEEEADESPFSIHVGQVYDGPLDLLLDLIRKQQIDIWDIPIAQITTQYLEYLDKAAALDMELSAEFIFMASTLIHIKSRMLLPRDPELEKIDPEGDPRKELVDRLLEYEPARRLPAGSVDAGRSARQAPAAGTTFAYLC